MNIYIYIYIYIYILSRNRPARTLCYLQRLILYSKSIAPQLTEEKTPSEENRVGNVSVAVKKNSKGEERRRKANEKKRRKLHERPLVYFSTFKIL